MHQTTAQQTTAQSLTRFLSPSLKRHPLVGRMLKMFSHVTALFTNTGMFYEDTVTIVRLSLRDAGIDCSLEQIKEYQEELKTLFKPEQRLEWGTRQLLFYPFVRGLKPNVIVETGCAWGGSASFLLAALAKNGKGKLISLDVPAADIPQCEFMGVKKGQIGALIPQDLRSRWTLIEGDSRLTLGKVMAENDVDLFIHDSLHTATHQAFEYITARAMMRDGTFIGSDDVRWNDAFRAFVKLHGMKGYAPIEDKNIAIATNRFDTFEKENGLFR